MPEDANLHDVLSPALQSTADKKLAGGEHALMTLAGAHGEGLVVTDQRVMILREQMPIVGSETEVDSFEYSYEQIQTVLVEDAAGGGHLKLQLFAPPPDDKQVNIYFPSYDLAKFTAAAARIRILVEQTRGVSLTGSASPETASPAMEIVCPQCGSPVDERDLFCAHCGKPLGEVCGACLMRLPDGALFCPACGSSASERRSLACANCGKPVAPGFVFCASCGTVQGRRCQSCGAPALADWARCPHCGRSLATASTQPSVWSPAAPSVEAADSPQARAESAAEHNTRGMRLYEQERYEEAVSEFETALDLAPGTPLYHCNLGVSYAELGRDDEALEEYETAIRIAPNDPTAYLNLGYFHSEHERAQQAREAWTRAMEVAPGSPEAEEARQNLEHMGEV